MSDSKASSPNEDLAQFFAGLVLAIFVQAVAWPFYYLRVNAGLRGFAEFKFWVYAAFTVIALAWAVKGLWRYLRHRKPLRENGSEGRP